MQFNHGKKNKTLITLHIWTMRIQITGNKIIETHTPLNTTFFSFFLLYRYTYNFLFDAQMTSAYIFEVIQL